MRIGWFLFVGWGASTAPRRFVFLNIIIVVISIIIIIIINIIIITIIIIIIITAALFMSVAEDAKIKSAVRANDPMEFWGCTNPQGYHADIFHTYINFANKRDLDVSEKENHSNQ